MINVERDPERARRELAQRWRVAVPRGCVEKVQPAVRERVEASLAALGARVQVTRDVEWPDLPWGARRRATARAERTNSPATSWDRRSRR